MVNTVQLQFSYLKRTLIFRFDAGTSRGVLKTRDVYWIQATDPKNREIKGWGEAAPLVKLSPDYRDDFEEVLNRILQKLNGETWESEQDSVLAKLKDLIPSELPAIRFGVETAVLDWKNGGKKRILTNDFFDSQKPIPINGLIWMGDREFMLEQIDQKLNEGFNCIKMKIGAIDFEQEIALLGYIRSQFSSEQITLRVDANGAFSRAEALKKNWKDWRNLTSKVLSSLSLQVIGTRCEGSVKSLRWLSLWMRS